MSILDLNRILVVFGLCFCFSEWTYASGYTVTDKVKAICFKLLPNLLTKASDEKLILNTLVDMTTLREHGKPRSIFRPGSESQIKKWRNQTIEKQEVLLKEWQKDKYFPHDESKASDRTTFSKVRGTRIDSLFLLFQVARTPEIMLETLQLIEHLALQNFGFDKNQLYVLEEIASLVGLPKEVLTMLFNWTLNQNLMTPEDARPIRNYLIATNLASSYKRPGVDYTMSPEGLFPPAKDILNDRIKANLYHSRMDKSEKFSVNGKRKIYTRSQVDKFLLMYQSLLTKEELTSLKQQTFLE